MMLLSSDKRNMIPAEGTQLTITKREEEVYILAFQWNCDSECSGIIMGTYENEGDAIRTLEHVGAHNGQAVFRFRDGWSFE